MFKRPVLSTAEDKKGKVHALIKDPIVRKSIFPDGMFDYKFFFDARSVNGLNGNQLSSRDFFQLELTHLYVLNRYLSVGKFQYECVFRFVVRTNNQFSIRPYDTVEKCQLRSLCATDTRDRLQNQI